MMMNEQELFGGNMKILLPSDAQDVSDLRQVPDNQEVFVHVSTDQSLMIELLSYVQEPDEQAIRTHFEDLARSNDAIGPDDNRILSIESIPTNRLAVTQCTSAYHLIGEQSVSKFNETSRNVITVHMTLLRLTHHDTDVILTFNDPVHISAQSSSSLLSEGEGQAAPQGHVGGDMMDVNMRGEEHKWTQEQFLQSVLSLQLVNPQFLN